MGCLDTKEVERLASKPKVKKVAVENFLDTVKNNPNAYAAIQNMHYDARIYKWNSQTVKAIEEGIKKYFSCKRK